MGLRIGGGRGPGAARCPRGRWYFLLFTHRRLLSGDSPISAASGKMRAMKCEITQVNGDGTIRRAVLDTTGRQDAARWERLAEQARLDLPPPYRPHPGEPVYEIAADERVAQVAEGDLVGPL